MATLLDWNALDHKLQSFVDQYEECPTKAVALTFVSLEYILALTPEELEDSITDGSNDRGIDAVFVDDRDGSNDIHLFQLKHVTDFQKSKNHFPSSEIDKMLSFVTDLLDQNLEMKSTCNDLLWNKVQEIWAALKKPKPQFHVHFCGNLQPMISTQQERVQNSLGKYQSFSVYHHSLETIVSLFLDKNKAHIDATIQLVDKNYFERTDGSIRGLIATVEAEELVKLIRDPDDSSRVRRDIFDDNVRIYMTRKNQVNKKILESALSAKNSEFWYLNNGVTITCESFSYQAGSRAPLVTLKAVQIVNGGQTSNALFEASEEDKAAIKNALVLVRIYETKTEEISNRIAESTNSQTPINTRDLRSNDDVQKKLEEGFKDIGLFYERKNKQHGSKAKQKRIDALSAGQALLAYTLKLPEIAKKERSKVFSDLYSEVFNDEVSPIKLLVPYRILQEIEKIKRDIRQKMKKQEAFDLKLRYIVDGAYHVLFTVSELCATRDTDPLDEVEAKKLIPESLTIVAKLVAEEEKTNPAFSFNRFFKDPRTKTKIQSKLAAATKTSLPRARSKASKSA